MKTTKENIAIKSIEHQEFLNGLKEKLNVDE